MATFIFLHGSFHAAWNWHKVMPLIEATGHRGVAPDVPGHGRDHTLASRVTLDCCVDSLLECIDAQPGKVVLVAHSRNGIIISQAAERRPEKITGLVYLAAYLVPNGRSMMEYAMGDTESLVVQNVEMKLSRGLIPPMIPLLKNGFMRWLSSVMLPQSLQVHRLKRSAYREALYHDCPDEIVELANVLLEPEPNWAGFTPLRLSPEHYGRVPKVYIECMQDRAVTLPLQRRMQSEQPCDRVYSLDTSHSPFFSQPAQFASTILDSLAFFEGRPRNMECAA